MFEISTKIYNLPHAFIVWNPHRKFIAEQELKRRSKYDENKLQACMAILFSDILMVTDVHYRYKNHVFLVDVLSVKILDLREIKGFKIKIKDSKGMDLICPTLP